MISIVQEPVIKKLIISSTNYVPPIRFLIQLCKKPKDFTKLMTFVPLVLLRENHCQKIVLTKNIQVLTPKYWIQSVSKIRSKIYHTHYSTRVSTYYTSVLYKKWLLHEWCDPLDVQEKSKFKHKFKNTFFNVL